MVVAPGIGKESLQGAISDSLETLTVMVEICERGFKHGAGLSEDRDVYCVVWHQPLQLCLVEAHVAGDDVGRQRVWMDKVGGESVRVTELVSARLHRQRHRQVVALREAKKQVLHGGAGRFVSLEEGHIGVLGFQARCRVGLERRTTKIERLHDPGERQ